jgi:hypothetical protein
MVKIDFILLNKEQFFIAFFLVKLINTKMSLVIS